MDKKNAGEQEAEIEEDERVFDETIFKEHLRNKLFLLFDGIPGKKDLFLDPSVLGALNISIEYSKLLDHGVNKVFSIDVEDIERAQKSQPEKEGKESQVNQIVFFVPPRVHLMKKISRLIKKGQTSHEKTFYLIFWPRRTILCKEALENFGVFADLIIKDFNFDLIPLDIDVLSLEIESCFKDIYVNNDLSPYTYVAESLQRIQLAYGNFQNIFAKGDGAKTVLEILKNFDQESKKFDETSKGDIETLILLDRNVDLITPMCTQLTYHGLVDEMFGIKNNMIQVAPQVLDKDSKEDKKTIVMNASDTIFKEIRDKNFSVLRNHLSERVVQIQKIIEEKNQEKSVQEMNVYIQKFKKVQKEYSSVTNHINIADYISQQMKSPTFYRNLQIEQGIMVGEKTAKSLDHLEVMIALEEPIEKVLRLLCLQSLIDNGLKQKSYDYFRREILQCYGFDKFLTLVNMEKVGLLKKQETKSSWQTLEKSLKLIYEDVNHEDPNDCSYAYSGYAPISAKLVEFTMKKNHWKGILDCLKLIPGPTIFNEKLNVDGTISKKRQVVMVFMIGGITYGEIAALRFLGKKYNKEIVIATTFIINGNSLLKSLEEKLGPELSK